MKKIYLFLTILALGVFVSCNKEAKVEIYTPEAGDGAYSFYAASTSNEFSAGEPTMEIELYRNTTVGSASVNLTSAQTIVNGAACNVLDIPSTATFADGQGRTKITVGYTSDMKVAVNYRATISMSDADCSFAGNKTLTLSAILAYTWESLGQGQWFDQLALMSNDSYGIANVEVLKAVGYDRYRIMNPYADNVQLGKAWSPAQVAGPKTTTLEFWVLADGATVAWDKWWYCGLLYDETDDSSSIKAYLPSALNASLAASDALSKFVETKVVEFHPYWYIDGIGGFGTKYPCFLSLPGGPDLNSWL